MEARHRGGGAKYIDIIIDRACPLENSTPKVRHPK